MLLLAAVGGAGVSLGFILGVLRHGRQRLKVIERRVALQNRKAAR